LTPEIQAAFLAELRRGTLVVAAAARVGMTVSTLYNRRRRDPAFDSAWTAAAEAGFGWRWDPERRCRVRAPGCRRRLRFGAARQAAFLDWLECTCNSSDSAWRAGFHPSTIVQALRRDPELARANQAALERGCVRLEREVALERQRSVERLNDFLESRRRGGGLGGGLAPAQSRFESIEALELRLSRTDPGGGRAERRRPTARVPLRADLAEALSLLGLDRENRSRSSLGSGCAGRA
jgi:hypothetical protein